jgi:hypothetical protein
MGHLGALDPTNRRRRAQAKDEIYLQIALLRLSRICGPWKATETSRVEIGARKRARVATVKPIADRPRFFDLMNVQKPARFEVREGSYRTSVNVSDQKVRDALIHHTARCSHSATCTSSRTAAVLASALLFQKAARDSNQTQSIISFH